ncbi:MAG: mechanosensitive ion channel family protein [Clostridiales bacterium]
MIESILSKIYFENTIRDYLISILIFILGVMLLLILRKIVLKQLLKLVQKTTSRIDDFFILQINKFVLPLIYLGLLYFSISILKMPQTFRKTIDSVTLAVFTFYAIRFLILITNNSIKFFRKSSLKEGLADQTSLKGISTFISIIIWGLGIVFFLDNLGFKVSAVIAGLGIGGIAVALAAQAVLGDFFSYFVIFFDRPFEIGDFISVDDKSGTVEKIGIKTTRVLSLGGEEIIFPNSNLTNSRLHNFKRMKRRRVSFKLSVVYKVSSEMLKEIPVLIKTIIEGIEFTNFERAHFQSYGESGLIFEVVYFVNTPDYNKYMDIQQEINLKIFKEFEKRKISFAYPTRSLFLEESPDNISLRAKSTK